MIRRANEAGGRDNITVVVIDPLTVGEEQVMQIHGK